MFGGMCRVETKVFPSLSCPLASSKTCRVRVRRVVRLEGRCHRNGVCSKKEIIILNHPDC